MHESHKLKKPVLKFTVKIYVSCRAACSLSRQYATYRTLSFTRTNSH